MATRTNVTKSTTTKKPASARTTERKPATAKTTQEAAEVAKPAANKSPMVDVTVGEVLQKKELIEAVTEKSGLKRGDAKKAVEAMLDELGAALQKNRELKLQPFGNIVIKRERNMENARILVARIRQSKKSTDEASE